MEEDTLNIHQILRTKIFWLSVLPIINLVIFFRFTLNTQLTFWTFGLILFLLYTLAYFVSKKISFSKPVIFIGLLPTVFNLFFLINYIFSSNPTVERYSFVHEKRWYAGKRFNNTPPTLEKIAYIDLEDIKYEEHNWFRMFLTLKQWNIKAK